MRYLTLLVATCVAFGQDMPKAPPPELGRLQTFLKSYQDQGKFIGSAFVAKGKNVYLDEAYGMANIELGVPNAGNTKFRLGSITKQFTATAILQLQERGKLSVKDQACKYIDGCPDSWKEITIHQLLTHTSGIPSYTALPEFSKPKLMRIPLSPVEIVMLTKDKPLDFPPGSKWNYDNSGYVFLGAIIEKVSGEKYADYLNKHIFSKLDMQDTGYDVTEKIIKNRAAGYAPDGSGFRNADYLDMSLPYAAGSLYSTTRDLYKWDRALYTDKILNEASREAMFTPVGPVKPDYAYGWMVAPMRGHKQVGHGGGINGFSTHIARFPDDDLVVIVLSNNQAGNASLLANGLAGIMFGDKVDLPTDRKLVSVDAKTLDRYTGTYNADIMSFTVTNENGHLMFAPKGQRKAEMFPVSQNQFILKVIDAEITFDTETKQLILRQSGISVVARKAP
jgi:D-alanyl-D-alanine carboxypeptidase